MKDEQWIKLSKILLIVASLMLICNGLYVSCKRGSGIADSNTTTRTVERLESEHESARSEVESGEREITAAEEHIERANDAVGRSEETAQRNAAGVNELQTLISECQGIVEAQRELIRDIDRANRIRPAEDAKN